VRIDAETVGPAVVGTDITVGSNATSRKNTSAAGDNRCPMGGVISFGNIRARVVR